MSRNSYFSAIFDPSGFFLKKDADKKTYIQKSFRLERQVSDSIHES